MTQTTPRTYPALFLTIVLLTVTVIQGTAVHRITTHFGLATGRLKMLLLGLGTRRTVQRKRGSCHSLHTISLGYFCHKIRNQTRKTYLSWTGDKPVAISIFSGVIQEIDYIISDIQGRRRRFYNFVQAVEFDMFFYAVANHCVHSPGGRAKHRFTFVVVEEFSGWGRKLPRDQFPEGRRETLPIARYISNTTVEIFASLKPTSYHHRLTVTCYTSGTHTEPRFILIAKMSTISEQRHGWSSYSYTQKVNLTACTHPPHGHLRAVW